MLFLILEANHHFHLSAKLGNMPQDTYWGI